MGRIINPTGVGGVSGLVPTIRATAPVGSSVTCDGQTKVVGSEGFVDFVVSAEPVNILPDGVQGLESIEATGTQYINTNIKWTSDKAEYRGWMMPTTTPYRDDYFGEVNSKSNWSDYQYGLRVGAWNSNPSINYAYGGTFPISLDANKKYDFDIIFDNGTLGGFFGSQLLSGTSGKAPDNTYIQKLYPIFLGAVCINGSVNRYGNLRLGDMDIIDNDVARGRFRPCIYNSQVGMWDIVTNSFFGNQGAGSFIANEPKEWLDYPTYTVTVNGISKTVTIEGVELRTVSF